ncbi:MAG: hypothetical protein LBM73_03685 [Candidatus Nomurabacteria bacterium]|jgi:hypothetical protein|nr:hypothetical protein [Candidatus Nomurabacteria bacterium]
MQLIIKETGEKVVVSPASSLWLPGGPDAYTDAMVRQANALRNAGAAGLPDGEDGFRQVLRETVGAAGEAAAIRDVYGLPLLVPGAASGMTTDGLVEAANRLKPDGVADAYICCGWKNPDGTLRSEFDLASGIDVDERDAAWSIVIVVMEKRDDPASLFRGAGLPYDGKYWTVKNGELDPLDGFDPNKDQTQTNLLRQLPPEQHVMGPPEVLSLANLQYALLKVGADGISQVLFGNRIVRTPAGGDVNQLGSGRIEAPDGNWYVPDVGPNDWSGRPLLLRRDFGRPDSDYVVGAVDGVKED